MKYVPKYYQKRIIKEMIDKAALGVLAYPGSGKTSCVLEAFRVLKEKSVVRNMLVVCPLRPMFGTWPSEMEKWDCFQDLTYTVIHGNIERKVNNISNIYLITPDGIRNPYFLRVINKFDMLVVDESTKFKHTNTLRHKALRKILLNFKRRYILTGSPIPNGLLDLYGQIYIVDRGLTLGKYITHFKEEHFYPLDYYKWKWRIKDGHEKIIYDKIAPITVFLTKDKYSTLPKIIEKDYYVDLPDKTRKLYKKLEREFIVSLKSGNIVASNAAVLTSKLRQIANGGIYDDKGNSHCLHLEKTQIILDIIDELSGHQALINYEFKHDLERLKEKIDGVNLSGIKNKTLFNDTMTKWNKGEISILFGQISSLAHGLNLQAGHVVIMHSQTWNLENDEQFIARIWRQGQKNNVFVYRIIAKDTIDEVVVEALKNKQQTQNALFEALRKRYLNG